jgi:phosphatidyl-myo-inositol alpha-mannosyltransferase
MKLGIVVPYSWSYWGGVVEHAEEQADALEQIGVETRIVIGHDPPGRLSGLLHPRAGRLERPPGRVIPVGRTVITPANESLANVVLDPTAVGRVRRALERERFDLLHVHEPLTPVIGPTTLAYADVPVVATFHAAGSSRWRAIAMRAWGFLLDRIDVRIAVSDAARRATQAYTPGELLLIPNGVRIPDGVGSEGRENTVVFVGRHEQRKGLPVLLEAWSRVHAETGARLRVIGADPLAVRLLLSRRRLDDTGIDLVGAVPAPALDAELARASLLAAPSLGGESFGMVLTRAFASGTPVVASDIEGYRDVVAPGAGLLVPPGDVDALAAAIARLLGDEHTRLQLAERARATAAERYAWPAIAARLRGIYDDLLDGGAGPSAPAREEAWAAGGEDRAVARGKSAA